MPAPAEELILIVLVHVLSDHTKAHSASSGPIKISFATLLQDFSAALSAYERAFGGVPHNFDLDASSLTGIIRNCDLKSVISINQAKDELVLSAPSEKTNATLASVIIDSSITYGRSVMLHLQGLKDEYHEISAGNGPPSGVSEPSSSIPNSSGTENGHGLGSKSIEYGEEVESNRQESRGTDSMDLDSEHAMVDPGTTSGTVDLSIPDLDAVAEKPEMEIDGELTEGKESAKDSGSSDGEASVGAEAEDKVEDVDEESDSEEESEDEAGDSDDKAIEERENFLKTEGYGSDEASEESDESDEEQAEQNGETVGSPSVDAKGSESPVAAGEIPTVEKSASADVDVSRGEKETDNADNDETDAQEEETDTPEAQNVDGISHSTQIEAGQPQTNSETPKKPPHSSASGDDDETAQLEDEEDEKNEELGQENASPAPRRKRKTDDTPGESEPESKKAKRAKEGTRQSSEATEITGLTPAQKYKRFQAIAINLIKTIEAHRFSSPFLTAVTAKEYGHVIKHPKDLKSILKGVKKKQNSAVYGSVKELERDIILMFTNCVMFNKSSAPLVQMARRMKEDVRNTFKMFEEAESGLS